MFGLFRKKQNTEFTKYDKKIDFLGISIRDLIFDLPIEKSRKIMEKSVDGYLKKISGMTEEELNKMRNDIKELRKEEVHFPKFVRDQYPHDKIGFMFSELQRLFVAIDEELKRRTKK